MDDSSLFGKVPPQNLEAEQSTLGSMMIDHGALEKALDMLKPGDFYREAHQIIFNALVSLAVQNEPVDIVTVQEELRSKGKLEAVGGTEYLMALIDSVPTAANVEYYAKIVEDKAILRRLIDACMQIIGWSHENTEDVDTLVDKAERLLFTVSQRRMGRFFVPLKELAHQAFERIEKQYKEKALVSGLATGFRDLDIITSGLQPADLIIVAGRPSMGKTAFCLDIARHVSIHEKKPVAIFSLEMSKEQLTIRLICSQSRVDSHRLRTGYIQTNEWTKLAEGVGMLYNAPIFIDDSTDMTPLQMRAKCRRLKAEHGLALVIIDYLQLMQSHRQGDNRNQEIAEIARMLKGLARELDVPVVVLSQLSRAVEQRQDKRPILSDLRESGAIEAEADLVAFLYRPDYYKHAPAIEVAGDIDNADSDEIPAVPQGETVVHKTEIIIAKQRNGPTGTIHLAFLPKFASFEDLEEDREEIA
ncbi:MAG: replicative DNA helicase [Armatimonadota bacterium]|nr:replicative DNA helicase [Armatimonadota bacterium]